MAVFSTLSPAACAACSSVCPAATARVIGWSLVASARRLLLACEGPLHLVMNHLDRRLAARSDGVEAGHVVAVLLVDTGRSSRRACAAERPRAHAWHLAGRCTITGSPSIAYDRVSRETQLLRRGVELAPLPLRRGLRGEPVRQLVGACCRSNRSAGCGRGCGAAAERIALLRVDANEVIAERR